MTEPTPIPIPLSQRWRMFRMRIIPVLVFLVALGGIIMLWERDSAPGSIVGEVYAPVSSVNSPRAGWLEADPFILHTAVRVGQEIAIIRSRPPEHAKLALAVLQEELRMIRLGVGDPVLDLRRNQLSWQGLRRDWLLVRTDLASLRVRMRQADIDQQRYRELLAKGADSRMAYEQSNALYLAMKAEEEGKSRLASELEAAVAEARRNESEAGYNDLAAGIAAAMDWKEAELRQLEAEIAPVSILAPISGSVTRIFHHPGNFVNLGEPVLEIRSDKAEYVIAYLKAPLAVDPKPGTTVEIISRRGVKAIVGRAEILDLGPQFDLLPTVFQRPMPLTIEERALPVRISLPESLTLLPGELVAVRPIKKQ
jgi:multidrug resistance efflux pump